MGERDNAIIVKNGHEHADHNRKYEDAKKKSGKDVARAIGRQRPAQRKQALRHPDAKTS